MPLGDPDIGVQNLNPRSIYIRMATKRKAESEEQKRLVSTIYSMFVRDGTWPSYRDVEKAVGLPLAPLLETVPAGSIEFMRPVGPESEIWLTLNGLESIPAAGEELTLGYKLLRKVAVSPEITLTQNDLANDMGLSESRIHKAVNLVEKDLRVHSIFSVTSRSADGSFAIGLSNYANLFADVHDRPSLDRVIKEVRKIQEAEARLNNSFLVQMAGRSSKIRVQNSTTPSQYHKKVEAASRQLLQGNHCAEAVRSAFQEFEHEVQRLSRVSDRIGKDLMAHVFNEAKPVLQLTGKAGATQRSRQEGLKFLAMGAMLAIRNPYSHGKKPALDRKTAEEQLALASQLFRLLDRTRLAAEDLS